MSITKDIQVNVELVKDPETGRLKQVTIIDIIGITKSDFVSDGEYLSYLFDNQQAEYGLKLFKITFPISSWKFVKRRYMCESGNDGLILHIVINSDIISSNKNITANNREVEITCCYSIKKLHERDITQQNVSCQAIQINTSNIFSIKQKATMALPNISLNKFQSDGENLYMIANNFGSKFGVKELHLLIPMSEWEQLKSGKPTYCLKLSKGKNGIQTLRINLYSHCVSRTQSIIVFDNNIQIKCKYDIKEYAKPPKKNQIPYQNHKVKTKTKNKNKNKNIIKVKYACPKPGKARYYPHLLYSVNNFRPVQGGGCSSK